MRGKHQRQAGELRSLQEAAARLGGPHEVQRGRVSAKTRTWALVVRGAARVLQADELFGSVEEFLKVRKLQGN